MSDQGGEEYHRVNERRLYITADRTMLDMTEGQYARFRELEQEILHSLAQAVKAGEGADSTRAQEIAALHRTWLSMAWKEYTPQAHRSLAAMYAADPGLRRIMTERQRGAQFTWNRRCCAGSPDMCFHVVVKSGSLLYTAH